MDRYPEALRSYARAREAFIAQGLNSFVVQCDLNSGVIYYMLNRYQTALELYQRAADGAMAAK